MCHVTVQVLVEGALPLHNKSFPDTKQRVGHCLRVSEKFGNALHFTILIENENVISSSEVCPQQSKEKPNLSLEQKKQKEFV